MVDWELALTTARTLAKTGPPLTLDEAISAVSELRRLAAVAEQHVATATGLTPVNPAAPPPARIVDRPGWLASNVSGLQTVVEPLLVAAAAGNATGNGLVASTVRGATAKAAALQLGPMLAYLSGRVLGQFDVLAPAPGQLLLVAPNIVEAERRLGVEPRDFRLWVCLHEVTHRWQFAAVDWLRDYFLTQVAAFLTVDAASGTKPPLLDRLRTAASVLADTVRNGDSRNSIVDVAVSPAQRDVVDRIMALMTLLEGHADYVMDGVGPGVVPSVALIRARFTAHRQAASPLHAVLRRLFAVETKLRQYTEGRAFVRAVVENVGMTGFNAVWESPETLPTLPELAEPALWLKRVG